VAIIGELQGVIDAEYDVLTARFGLSSLWTRCERRLPGAVLTRGHEP
jgi:hypothetical protein